MASATKKPVTKSTTVAEKKATAPVVKKTTEKVASEKVEKTISLPTVTLLGKETTAIEVPAALFAAQINKSLLSQATRVYLANQRAGSAHTKSRGEVQGSSRKIYRQKGTGRARHGTVRAPIFVKGGVAHGPKAFDHSLGFTKAMARKALISALSSHVKAKQIVVINGLEKIEPKTKAMVSILTTIGCTKKTLVLSSQEDKTVSRISRNIKNVTTMQAMDVSAYNVLSHAKLVFDARAVKEIVKRLSE
jgi:large subunit ribosomal protein L4